MKKNSADSRKAGFKFQGMTNDELRRRREENQVEIRKAKREDSLNKRRNIVEAAPAPPSTLAEPASEGDEQMQRPLATHAEASQKLPNMVQGLYSADVDTQLAAVIDFRKMLSKERNPPIQDVIACGVVGRFVQMLTMGGTGEAEHKVQLVQFEAAWVLTNIASGTSEQTRTVIEAGAVPIFVQLLSHPNADIREQCTWALGNIAGDSPSCRDYVLGCQIVAPLLAVVSQELYNGISRISLVRNATWTISNLCRGKPGPQWSAVAMALPALKQLLEVADDEVQADSCWAISYMSDGPNEYIADVIAAGVVPRLIGLLLHRNAAVQTPALRALGNIVTGDDVQTQTVIDHGALPAFLSLLSSTKSTILKEACWAISNITAGTPEQIQAVIDANLIPPLIHHLSYSDFKTKKEACWAICNATSAYETHPEQVKYLVGQGCIKPLCDLLACQDNKIIQVALDGLANILEVGERETHVSDETVNPFALYVEEAQGLDQICNLQHHENHGIYVKTKNIIDKYFFAQEDDFEVAPDQAESQGFQFNHQASTPQGGFNF